MCGVHQVNGVNGSPFAKEYIGLVVVCRDMHVPFQGRVQQGAAHGSRGLCLFHFLGSTTACPSLSCSPQTGLRHYDPSGLRRLFLSPFQLLPLELTFGQGTPRSLLPSHPSTSTSPSPGHTSPKGGVPQSPCTSSGSGGVPRYLPDTTSTPQSLDWRTSNHLGISP